VELKGRGVLVVGLARSGVGSANLLSRAGAHVTVTDRKPEEELTEYIGQLAPSIKLCLGGYPRTLNGTELVVVSPGVPLSIEPIVSAKERGIKIIGELELGYQVMRSRSASTEFLAVTGTNGKSTTTTLLEWMLRKSGFKTMLGGNIGNALTAEITKAMGTKSEKIYDDSPHLSPLAAIDYVVAEVSSFQLESIEGFRPKGAAILNVTADHLDRYRSMDEYRETKARVALNQDGDDFLVLNADDPEVMKLRIKGPRLSYFSRRGEVQGVYLRDETVCSSVHGPLVRADEIRIKGIHNLENAMAASAMALLAGCTPRAVAGSLGEFPGLEHRLELVREMNGVRYVNDSKGTNVGAVMKSLESFSGPIVLIAGGRDKAGDFIPLRPFMERVKELILIGEARDKMRAALCDLARCSYAESLEGAVSRARDIARAGDVVLLSPACASFDMFRDFEDRGRQFKELVNRL
jgi:UDP-N-acetylmuramoylalanine--D-glutamate ligase